jgi:hypothetical protein
MNQNDVVAAAPQRIILWWPSELLGSNVRMVIAEGNKAGIFGLERLREVALLKVMDVRWSSTFLMIDRVLELCPVSCVHSYR